MNLRASCGLNMWYPWFRISAGYIGLRRTALNHSMCWTRVKFPVFYRWSVLYQSDEERNNAGCPFDKYFLAAYFTKIKECFACSYSWRQSWTSGSVLEEGTNHKISGTHFDLKHLHQIWIFTLTSNSSAPALVPSPLVASIQGIFIVLKSLT